MCNKLKNPRRVEIFRFWASMLLRFRWSVIAIKTPDLTYVHFETDHHGNLLWSEYSLRASTCNVRHTPHKGTTQYRTKSKLQCFHRQQVRWLKSSSGSTSESKTKSWISTLCHHPCCLVLHIGMLCDENARSARISKH